MYQECYDYLVAELQKTFDPTSPTYLVHYRKLIPIEPDKETYSSAHMVIDVLNHFNGTPLKIPVEVQIRTASEDIWAEINHRFHYKITNFHVWSAEIEKLHEELNANSSALKLTLESLPPIITRFIQHSDNVEKYVHEFRRPSTQLHTSLVVTLFYALTHRRLDQVAESLAQYDRKISEIREIADREQAARQVYECVRLFKGVQKNLRLMMREESIGSPDYLVCQQREILAEFEIIRLKTIALLQFGFRVTRDGIQETDNNKRRHLLNLFNALCKLEEIPALKVRPTTVILYWKYLMMCEYAKNDAVTYLREAYDSLEKDASLPDWSIYRILVPRTRALEVHNEVEQMILQLHESMGEHDALASIFIFRQVRAELQAAIGFASQAYLKGREKDYRRGDLLFQTKENDVIDADLVLSLSLMYSKLCGGNEAGESGMDKAVSDMVIQELREALTLGGLSIATAEDIARKLGQVEGKV